MKKSPNHRRIMFATLILLIIIVAYYLLLPRSTILVDPVNTNGPVGGTPPSLESRISAAELSWQLYVKKRNAIVRDQPENVSPWSNSNQYQWEYFVPTFSCPYSIDRVGKLGDGGKFTCGVELFGTTNLEGQANNPCVVYSFGVSGESSFEAEMLERTNCAIYAFDASVNKMGPQVSKNNPRIHFKEVFVGTTKDTNLRFLMEQNGHHWIDFLKMDIEGGEFSVLNQVMDDFEILPFAQLAVEIHTNENSFPALYKFWKRMEDKGLRAFKNEINLNSCVNSKSKPFLMEYSFLNLRGEHRVVSPKTL